MSRNVSEGFLPTTRKCFRLMIMAILLTGSQFSYSIPCNPEDAWKEAANKLGENTPERTNPTQDLQASEGPQDDIELTEMTFRSTNPNLLPERVQSTFRGGRDESGFGGILEQVSSTPEVEKETQAFYDQIYDLARKIVNLGDSGFFDASYVSMKENTLSSVTDDAITTSEGGELDIGEAIEAGGMDGLVVLFGQLIYNSLTSGLHDIPTAPAHYTALDKSKLAMEAVPVIGQVYGSVIDMVQAGQQHLPAVDVIEIGLAGIVKMAMGFVSLDTVDLDNAMLEISSIFSNHGNPAEMVADNVVNAMVAESYVNPVITALKSLVFLGYHDVYTCPLGTYLDPETGCRIESLRGSPEPEAYVHNNTLYLKGDGKSCPANFKQEGNDCVSSPAIDMDGRDLVGQNKHQVIISPWLPDCGPGSHYDKTMQACQIDGLPSGSVKGRTIINHAGQLEISNKSGKPCPGSFKSSMILGNKSMKTCVPPIPISLYGRKAFIKNGNLYTSTAPAPNTDSLLRYLTKPELYSQKGDPNKLYYNLLMAEDGDKFKQNVIDMMDALKAMYPLLMMQTQGSIRQAQENMSLSYLTSYQVNTAINLAILRGYTTDLEGLNFLQLNKLLNMSYNGIVGCNSDLMTEPAFRSGSDALSWVHYCFKSNQKHNTLLFGEKEKSSDHIDKIVTLENNLRDKKHDIAVATVKKIIQSRNDTLSKFNSDMKKEYNENQAYQHILSTVNDNLSHIGSQITSSVMDNNALCLFSHPAFSGAPNNCNVHVIYNQFPTAHHKGHIHEYTRGLHAKCWGNKDKVASLLNNIANKAYGFKRKAGSYSTYIYGDCGRSDITPFVFNKSLDTLFNPDNLQHPLAKDFLTTKTYFESNDANHTPYTFDISAFSKMLSGQQKELAELYPHMSDSFSSGKQFTTVLNVSDKSAESIKNAEKNFFTKKLGFNQVINNFLTKYLKGKKHDQVIDESWGTCKSKNSCEADLKEPLTLFEYVFLEASAAYCEAKQTGEHADDDCYKLVLPYSRALFDKVQALDEIQIFHYKDKSAPQGNQIQYMTYHTRPKKPEPDKSNSHAYMKFHNDPAVVIKLAGLPLTSLLTVNLTEYQYAKLKDSPSELYRARLMEQAYLDYGGWMVNLDDELKKSQKPAQTDHGNVSHFIDDMSVNDNPDLYNRSQGVKKTIGQAFANRSKDKVTSKYAKVHNLAGSAWSAAVTNIVNNDATIELFKMKDVKADDYNFLKSGWLVTLNKDTILAGHEPEDNKLSFDHLQLLESSGPISFKKKTSPVYKYTDNDHKEHQIDFNSAVKGGFIIDCIDMPNGYLLNGKDNSLLTLTIGDKTSGKTFSVDIDKNDHMHVDGLNTQKNTDIQLISQALFCSSLTHGSASPETDDMNYVEFFFGRNPGADLVKKSKTKPQKDTDKTYPYIYKFMINGHLISGEVPEQIYHEIDITQVEIVSNYKTTRGLTLYNPFTFYYKAPDQVPTETAQPD